MYDMSDLSWCEIVVTNTSCDYLLARQQQLMIAVRAGSLHGAWAIHSFSILPAILPAYGRY
jgi:hypothetical protein